VGDVDGRGEGDGGPGYGGNLFDFGGGAVQPGKPGPRCAGRCRKRLGRKVIHVRDCRVVLLPDHSPVGGSPNLSTTLWVGPPAGTGRLVEQDDLTRREP